MFARLLCHTTGVVHAQLVVARRHVDRTVRETTVITGRGAVCRQGRHVQRHCCRFDFAILATQSAGHHAQFEQRDVWRLNLHLERWRVTGDHGDLQVLLLLQHLLSIVRALLIHNHCTRNAEQISRLLRHVHGHLAHSVCDVLAVYLSCSFLRISRQLVCDCFALLFLLGSLSFCFLFSLLLLLFAVLLLLLVVVGVLRLFGRVLRARFCFGLFEAAGSDRNARITSEH